MEYFAFQWHITEACDQRCRHCYIYALGSHARAPRRAGEVAGFDFCGAALSLQRVPWGDPEHWHGVLHPGHGHRVLPLGGEPHLPGELHRWPRTGKAQGLHHYRGLHQLRRLCGSLPTAGHHLGRAQRHPPGALPPLQQLRGALPRGGRYTKGAGDRPSGNLTQGSCGLLAEEGFFFGSVNRKSIFLARPIYGFHWNMF